MASCWGLQMSPAQKSVLISLADNANDEGYCWPSLEKISERTCLSRRAVINAIAWLESVGLLRAIRDNGRHTRYVVTPDSFRPAATKKAPPDARGFDVWVKQQNALDAAQKTSKPVHQMHGCSKCTGARDAPDPCTRCTGPVHQMHTNRQEPSKNRQEGKSADSPPPPVQALPGQAVNDATVGKQKSKTGITFATWRKSLRPGEEAIPANAPVFRYAEDAGIPVELLALAWEWFKRTYTGPRKAKRYADWRQVFRNAVEGNWPRLWRFTPDGDCVITTEGIALRNVLAAESAREAA